MANFEFSEAMKGLAEGLIESVPEFDYIKMAAPRIAYLESDQEKTSHGMLTYGDCEKVKPKMKEFMDYDYIITFYVNNIRHLDGEQLKILMMHELYHIDCERDGNDELTCRIRPHDIQEFGFIRDKFGIDWDR